MSSQNKTLSNLGFFFRNQLSTLDGFQDAVDISSNVSDWVAEIGVSSIQLSEFTSTLKKSSTLLAGFSLLKDCSEVLVELSETFNTDKSSDDLAHSGVLTSAYKVSRVASTVLNSSSNVLIKTNEVGWVKTPKIMPIATVVFSATDIFSNVCDLCQEVFLLKNREEQLKLSQVSQKEKRRIANLNVTSVLNILNNLTGIAGSALSLFVLLAGGPPVLLTVGLILSSSWLVTKIMSKFYQSLKQV